MIRIGEPAATIDTPLEHLTACHRRIEDRLEVSLFPRLRPRLTGEEVAHLDRLEQQHREVESVFAELKEVVAEIAGSPQQAIPLETRYRELVTRLSGLYRPHIQFEDEVLMRLARRILNQGELENISQEMRNRRQKAERDPSTLRDRTDELARRVLEVFIEMGSQSLDLHTLFEAGGNDPATRQRVLDVVMRLVDTGHLESRGSDFYLLTGKGRRAAG